MLKRFFQKLPVLERQQVCPACGESFACELSLAKGCWCTEVTVSEETRAELSKRYDGCLCRNCLENAVKILAE